MQEANEVGKWVTDGTHTYPYNMFLDSDINSGKLKFCAKPEPKAATAPVILTRKALTMTLEEREDLATRLGISVGDLGNMSPQELAAAEESLKTEQALDIFAKA